MRTNDAEEEKEDDDDDEEEEEEEKTRQDKTRQDKKEASRPQKTDTEVRAGETESKIISGLAGDKPGQHRANEAKRNVANEGNGAKDANAEP